MERGYASVKLREIADALGIKQASLYYHVPGGKEALYVAVVERKIKRTQADLEQIIAHMQPDWQAQLRDATYYLLEQTPMDMSRMMQSDMHALSEGHTEYLMGLAWE
ncbi:MAG: TetR/AcrR family transcriptional regulator, partial [Chloroflexota bacterium]